MPGHDQLTALDAAFLELEQADDGALIHARDQGAARCIRVDHGDDALGAEERVGARYDRARTRPTRTRPCQDPFPKTAPKCRCQNVKLPLGRAGRTSRGAGSGNRTSAPCRSRDK